MESLNQKTLGIVGFGAQAKAWALNYRDSGHRVVIALRKDSPSLDKARELGFETVDLATTEISPIGCWVLLTPDDRHLAILKSMAPNVQSGSTFIYAHGYSMARENLASNFSQFNHILLAPKAIASEVRFRYSSSEPIMAAYSLASADSSWNLEQLEQFARDLGFTVLIETSFEEEAKTDLFSEQSLLCGLIPYAALASYNKLREKGVNKHLAYIECWQEVLLIAKAMIEHGPSGLFELISPNALIGGEKAASILVDEEFSQKLDSLLEDVWSGTFYKNVDQCDYPKLKESVTNFWKKQEIQAVYEELKSKTSKK